MDQWQAMRIFRAIVETGGFSAAAERPDSSHSTISRQLKWLEQRLGAQLLNRNTRKWALTPAGTTFYTACVDALDRIDAAAAAIADDRSKIGGSLRVSVPLAISALELGDWLPGFQARYPQIRLDLSSSDRLIDLVGEGFDLALRISPTLGQHRLICRTLTVSERILVAAPAYVNQYGLPRTPEQLAEHRLIGYSSTLSSVRWRLSDSRAAPRSIDTAGALRVDTITTAHAAALAGVGIGEFTRLTVRTQLASGALVHILPDHTTGRSRYCAVYPHTRHTPAPVRAFIDHYVGALPYATTATIARWLFDGLRASVARRIRQHCHAVECHRSAATSEHRHVRSRSAPTTAAAAAVFGLLRKRLPGVRLGHLCRGQGRLRTAVGGLAATAPGYGLNAGRPRSAMLDSNSGSGYAAAPRPPQVHQQ